MSKTCVALETQNLAKNEFLAETAHEICTPVSGIVSFAELNLRTKVDC